ncbi:MAG: Rpn family recombination-promoting nuclease/putative transposase [Magnetococcus sp. YQC-5]
MKWRTDPITKLLFSHPEMVRDLILGFVQGNWVARLDFSTLEKANALFVGDEFRDREDDVIWRLRFGDVWLYVYILLEFQALIDDFMPLRVGDYMFSLYQDLRRAKQLPDKKLPPILPVVVYTGKQEWDVPLDINEMIVPVPGLEIYQLHMRYLVLDVTTMAESELESLRNLAAVLFRLEKSRSVETVRKLVRTLQEWLKAPEQISLRRAFAIWLRRVLLPKRLPKADIPEMTDLYEVDTMLAESVQEWVKPWMDQGRQDGIQIGEAKVLTRQLQRRFGHLPAWANEKIAKAELPVLEEWTLRILDAPTLDGVFTDKV